jgi:hypothetical protein
MQFALKCSNTNLKDPRPIKFMNRKFMHGLMLKQGPLRPLYVSPQPGHTVKIFFYSRFDYLDRNSIHVAAPLFCVLGLCLILRKAIFVLPLKPFLQYKTP